MDSSAARKEDPDDHYKLDLSLSFGGASSAMSPEKSQKQKPSFSRAPRIFMREQNDWGVPSVLPGQLLQQPRLTTQDGPMPVQPPQSANSSIHPTLWQACAGPLTMLPKVGSKVVYFPQGHLEQVRASLPIEKLHALSTERTADHPPPHMICHVVDVTLHADGDTDEVFAQITLLPLSEEEVNTLTVHGGGEAEEEPEEKGDEKRVAMFSKALTASDTSTHGGFSVPRKGAGLCLPRLDYLQQNPNQMLVARDFHGQAFQFRHIFRGFPRRHLLTTGWSHFVNKKRLLAGDSIIFVRGEDSQLWLGVRRINRMIGGATIQLLTLDAMNGGVLRRAAHAVRHLKPFKFIYVPRACDAPFVIPYEKFRKNLVGECSQPFVGMRFRMLCETEDSTVRSSFGIVTGCNDLDQERFANSLWRCYQVKFDEATFGPRLERISPWEIEALDITVMEMGGLAMHINSRPKRPRPVSAVTPPPRRPPPASSSSRSDISGSMESSEEDDRQGGPGEIGHQGGGSAGSEEDRDWAMSTGRMHSARQLAAAEKGQQSTGTSHQHGDSDHNNRDSRKADKLYTQMALDGGTRSEDTAAASGRHTVSPPAGSAGPGQLQSASERSTSHEIHLVQLRLSSTPPPRTRTGVALAADPNQTALGGAGADMPLFSLEPTPMGGGHVAPAGARQGWDFQNPTRILHSIRPRAPPASLPLPQGVRFLGDLNQSSDLASVISGVLAERATGSTPAAAPLVQAPRLVPYLRLRTVDEDSAATPRENQIPMFHNTSTSACFSSLTSASATDIPSPSTASGTHNTEGCTRLFGFDIPTSTRPPGPRERGGGGTPANPFKDSSQPSPVASGGPMAQETSPSGARGGGGVGVEEVKGPPQEERMHEASSGGTKLGRGVFRKSSGSVQAGSRCRGPGTIGFVKVYKEGSRIGRSLDLNKLSGYDELREEINKLLGLEGPDSKKWMYVFDDKDGDRLLLGDDPWENFVFCAQYIHVLPNLSSQASGAHLQTSTVKDEPAAA